MEDTITKKRRKDSYGVLKSTYIKQSLKEHMLNPNNYVRLSPDEAVKELKEQKLAFEDAYAKFGDFDDEQKQYFERSFQKHHREGSRTPKYYSTWKVHKKKPSVRPVISSCGSFAEIFSIFIDKMLKQLVQDVLKSYIISADQLVHTLSTKFPSTLPEGVLLFSIDAVGMYINISTPHALKVVEEFIELYADELKDLHLPKKFIVKCLEIVMNRNIFEFGDTFWRQINGTAMGTSCAVNYAFLYLGLLKMINLLIDFEPWLLFYGRFIDDGIGLWHTRKPGSARAWNDFMQRLNLWGRL